MKKLERVKELVVKLDCKLFRLKQHGFKKLTGINSSSKHIYVNEKLRVIVKRPYLSWEDATVPKMACPTVVIKTNDPKWGRMNTIYIQPLVDTSDDSKWKAYSVLTELDREGYDCGQDLRESNCGVYRRRAVVFDW